MRHLVLLLLSLATLHAGEGAAAVADVVLLIGQSNMDGRGKVADLPAELAAPAPTIRLFYRNPPAASAGWVALAPGYSLAPNTKPVIPSATFGPEISFGPALVAAVPTLRLALIKASKGGTSLAKDWKPGEPGKPDTQGPCYRNLMETLKDALPALGAHRLRGAVWHQGESDAGLPAGEYRKLLAAFIPRLRADVGVADLPFVIGEVYDNGKRDAVRAGQQAVAAEVPGTAFVPCAGTRTWDDGTHFDAAGQLELGRRYAAALAGLLKPAK